MKNPRVSIIIPTYNREELIIKAINSVSEQTFKDFEILIVDDASTDQTEKVITNLNHPQVRYFKLKENKGQCIARNYGLTKALGEYVAFLDSDDTWMPEKLEKQVECFEGGSARLGAVYCYSYQRDMISGTTTLNDSGYHRGDIHNHFLVGFCPPTPSLFLVKKSALDAVGGFDEELITFVDLDLWMRISEKYDFDYVETPLIIKYEQIGDQYINNFEKRYKGYGIFFHKWEDIVREKLGKKELLKLKQHVVGAIIVPLLEHPPANLRRNVPKLIGLLVGVRSKEYKYYIKCFIILIFGVNIFNKIRSMRSRIIQE